MCSDNWMNKRILWNVDCYSGPNSCYIFHNLDSCSTLHVIAFIHISFIVSFFPFFPSLFVFFYTFLSFYSYFSCRFTFLYFWKFIYHLNEKKTTHYICINTSRLSSTILSNHCLKYLKWSLDWVCIGWNYHPFFYQT